MLMFTGFTNNYPFEEREVAYLLVSDLPEDTDELKKSKILALEEFIVVEEGVAFTHTGLRRSRWLDAAKSLLASLKTLTLDDLQSVAQDVAWVMPSLTL
ncbi:MAG: hypothetical protein QNK11_10060 [Legionella sp.]|nr:hypothetical protein [Legionella sp.]